MFNRHKLIDEIGEDIKRYIKAREDMAELVLALPEPEDFEAAGAEVLKVTTSGTLDLLLPWDVANLRQVRKILGRDWEAGWRGPRVWWEFEAHDSRHRCFRLKHKRTGQEIRLSMVAPDGDEPGPKCRRVVAGFKQVPVYKVVCDEEEVDG